MANLIIWDTGGLPSNPYGGGSLTVSNYNSFSFASSAYIFDLRVMNKAISESGGTATNSDDLGAISYAYNDMLTNNGKTLLPFG